MQVRKIVIAACAAALMASCSPKSTVGPALLSGDIIGEFKDVVIIPYGPGPRADYICPETSEGHFEVELDGIEGFIDLAVAVDDDVFGARVNAGDSLKLTFTAKGDTHFDVAYDGPTGAESRIWTDWYEAYGYLGKYNIKPDADPDITPEQSLELLDENDAAFRARYGSGLSDYHVLRADLGYGFLASVLIENIHGYDYSKIYADRRYLDIIKKVDPDNPYTVSSGLLARWAGYRMRDLGDDDVARRLAFLRKFKGEFRNPDTRKGLAEYCSFPLWSSPQDFDDAQVTEFVEAIRSFDEGSAEVADRCVDIYEAFKATRPGSPMPDVELTCPDGGKILLSSLFGKVIYMDMWATWCGPCVKETPAMAALAERMKGRDDILCISVSCDRTAEPWLGKLAEDKPEWPQYRLEPEADAAFSSNLNITTIPRFIIVGKDGTIFDADAVRPSDPDIDSTLLKAAE